MAEAEQSDKTTPTPLRRPHYQGRPGSSYRGRGRANASVNKALHLFGVRDLREILDRKHQDEEQTKSGPPPDPSYSYLKDPSRENAHEHQNQRYYKERTFSEAHPRGHNFRGSRGRGRGSFRDNRQHEPEKAFIQNPVNIKVEVSASTGERNCQVDGDTKIPDIKHIPNYKLKDLRPRNEGEAKDFNNRHRNEGREPGGPYPGKDFSDRSRNEAVAGRDFSNRYGNERGRGRGQRSRGGRGRGYRGRGRGQYRHSNRPDKVDEEQQQTTDADVLQENWDKECVDASVKNEGNEGKDNEDNHEEECADEQEPEIEGQEEYYEGEEEYSEAIEQNQSLDEASGGGEIKLEENLVVTSLDSDEKPKRTVKFKLDDKDSEQARQQEVKGEEKDVEKELPEKQEDKKLEK